ncbi:Transcriptional regulator, AcrR family [Pseudomonas chlororaphis subsp. aureofaciens]|uniref:TetR/AcrR family transcriptional regulator n=1 Tax=Pseudomonas chlororaphis TaxID=587753 RepID=UPI000F562208|nr:TetR/AcrR family transcriptional regulator [Pseudomonas chlororaphis]AZD84281.1 Transcriptional regulator, AcrR family [Pseudomonas chlororaphis subsp. aureofaciens]
MTTNSTTGRPREFDRDTAIETAMQVFWSNGYEGTSTQALCERTGLGKGSLYNAFGSKQKLYELALQHYQELALVSQKKILNGPGTASERLRALLQWGVDEDLNGTEHRTCMALFAAMERAQKDLRVQKMVRSHVVHLETALCEVFAAGQLAGDIARDRPALEKARAFLSNYFGLRILGQSMPDRAFLQDALEGALARL